MRLFAIILFVLVALAFTYSSCKKNSPGPSSSSPALIAPLNNSKMRIDSLKFSWNAGGSSNWKIQIANDSVFANIVDQASDDSDKYFSLLKYTTQYIGYPSPVTKTPNYVMGQTYYWRVISQSSPVNYSAVQSFSIIDTRDSIVGNWSGTFEGDTSYHGSMAILKNSDGSITTNGLGYDLYPSATNDFDFSNGCLSSCNSGGDSGGGDCNYNTGTKVMTFSTAYVHLGGSGGSTFTGTR